MDRHHPSRSHVNAASGRERDGATIARAHDSVGRYVELCLKRERESYVCLSLTIRHSVHIRILKHTLFVYGRGTKIPFLKFRFGIPNRISFRIFALLKDFSLCVRLVKVC